MVGLAEKARREGLLALEAQLEEVDDQFTKKGVSLIVDGTDSSVVETILHSEIDGMAQPPREEREALRDARRLRADARHPRHRALSLVHVLENLSNPGALGHSIAGAFIATLYGVGSRQPHLPADRQPPEGLSEVEVNYREMILEGVLALQAGDNPRMLAERLDTFLDPAERARPPADEAARPRRGCRGRALPGGGRHERGTRASGRRRGGDHGGGHEGGDERWLLTYADMITLLMALFIVMWAISSVNTTKFAELSVSLKQAFNGKLVDGGENIQAGARSLMPQQPTLVGDAQGKPTATDPISVAPPSPSFDPITVDPSAHAAAQIEAAEAADLENLQRLKHRLDRWAADARAEEEGRDHDRRARPRRPRAHRRPALRQRQGRAQADRAAAARHGRGVHPRHARACRTTSASRATPTTSPISNAEFRSNWELSAARATAVLESLLHNGVAAGRLSATAYADQRPLATNGSAKGRSTNRRVELVVLRRAASGLEGATP